MEWIERLNQTMEYIEEHLSEEINIEEVAQIACCSTYHFQRMFAYMSGVPLSEYIRRRRMSLAAVDLLCGEDKVIDIALKYGYQSPTAFNRAFQGIHGIAPSLVKEEHAMIKSFPPISFQITIKGAEEMNYQIVKKEAFRMIGISEPLYKELEKNFEIVPKMWQKAVMNGTTEKLLPLMNGHPMGLLGVSVCNDDEEWRYFIAVTNDEYNEECLGTVKIEEYTIPAATWAIFSGKGTGMTIQELEKRIVTEWLPTSGYEYGNAPDIEVYLNSDPENMEFEVWIPVIKKV